MLPWGITAAIESLLDLELSTQNANVPQNVLSLRQGGKDMRDVLGGAGSEHLMK